MNIDYSLYTDFVKSLDDISDFKQNPKYKWILEHVTSEEGEQYYNELKYVFDDRTILNFCSLNDSVGNPHKNSVVRNTNVSATSLRYLYHAHLILSNLQGRNIVEVGGGYGGLCLAIDFVSKLRNITISSYSIIDLKDIIRLQELYLKKFNLGFPVAFHDASTYGSNITTTDNFLISNYCISEIAAKERHMYYNVLLPKISHGFIIWNIREYDFPRQQCTIKMEVPLTGTFNRFIYF
jgi:hypothetical protein